MDPPVQTDCRGRTVAWLWEEACLARLKWRKGKKKFNFSGQ